MSKKFGLDELETLGNKVGEIDNQVVKIAEVVSVMLKVPFTAESEAVERAKNLEAEIVQLGTTARAIEETAAAKARVLRATASKVEEDAKYVADVNRGTATRRTVRRNEVLSILGHMKKS